MRTTLGSAPAASCCSFVSWLCIMLAGCAISVRVSPKFATKEIICTLLTTFCAASNPPLHEKVKRPLAPFGKYFFARALYLFDVSPAYDTVATSSF